MRAEQTALGLAARRLTQVAAQFRRFMDLAYQEPVLPHQPKSQIWLDFVGRIDSRAGTIRLRGHDGGIVEFAPDDVHVEDHLISVRLDAAARLIEPRSSDRWRRTSAPTSMSDVGGDASSEDTTTIGLVVFSCHPFRPVGICFDLTVSSEAGGSVA